MPLRRKVSDMFRDESWTDKEPANLLENSPGEQLLALAPALCVGLAALFNNLLPGVAVLLTVLVTTKIRVGVASLRRGIRTAGETRRREISVHPDLLQNGVLSATASKPSCCEAANR